MWLLVTYFLRTEFLNGKTAYLIRLKGTKRLLQTSLVSLLIHFLNMTFAEAVKHHRKKKGLTQTEVALLIRAQSDSRPHGQNIMKWEKGKESPRLETAIIASKILEFSLDSLSL